jgi:kynurenine formamidase
MATIVDLSHPIENGMITYSGFKFFAVPAPVKGMGSFPVRAFALID